MAEQLELTDIKTEQTSKPLEKPEDTPKSDAEKEKAAILEMFNDAIQDDDTREAGERWIKKAREQLGIRALEDPDAWSKGNLLEEVFHYMRWEPNFLTSCDINKLIELENCLSVHIVYVKYKENEWGTMHSISQRQYKRALKLAASTVEGASVGEREAVAVQRFTILQKSQEKLDAKRIYHSLCQGLAETLIQADNSLKKVIDKRKYEDNQAKRN